MATRSSLLKASIACTFLACITWIGSELASTRITDSHAQENRTAASQIATNALRRIESQLNTAVEQVSNAGVDTSLITAQKRFDRNGDYRAQIKLNQSLGKLVTELPWAGTVDLVDRNGLVIASSEQTRIGENRRANPAASSDVASDAYLNYEKPALQIVVAGQNGNQSDSRLEYSFAAKALAADLQSFRDSAAALRLQVNLDSGDATARLYRFRTGDAIHWQDGETQATAVSDVYPLTTRVEIPNTNIAIAKNNVAQVGTSIALGALVIAMVLMCFHALAPYLHGIALLRHMRPGSSTEVEAETAVAAEAIGKGEHSPSERMAYDILATHHVLEEVLREHTGELEKLYRVLNEEHRKRDTAEAALKAAEARFHEAVESSMDGVWEWRKEDGFRTWISASFRVTLGLRTGTFTGSFKELAELMHPDDLQANLAAFQQQVRFGSHFELEYRLRDQQDQWHWFSTRGQVIRSDGHALRVTGCIQNIHARKHAELEVKRLLSELEQRAHHDGMTGLHNRTSFMQQSTAELKRAGRSSLPTSVIMMDLDYFKSVNDQHGHLAGDRVLREFSAALLDEFRESDICARIGGEEFAILLPETSVEQATQLAERIRVRIAGLVFHLDSGRKLQITCSSGVATQLPDESLEALISRADERLYYAKREGRNKVCSANAPLLAVS